MKRNKPISDKGMQSKHTVIQAVKSFKRFQFVGVIEILSSSSVVVVLDILDFKLTGQPMQVYRQWVTVEQHGNSFHGHTFGYRLTFSHME